MSKLPPAQSQWNKTFGARESITHTDNDSANGENGETTLPCRMSFVNSKDRLYSHNDMEVLNLVSHPIWVFDYVNKKKWWANSAALEFWNARTLEDLTTRSFDDMSETAQRKNMDSLERLKRNESWVESVSKKFPNFVTSIRILTPSLPNIHFMWILIDIVDLLSIGEAEIGSSESSWYLYRFGAVVCFC